MKLTPQPETVNWPDTHYVFVERVGPIAENAPQTWDELLSLLSGFGERDKITGRMALYKMPDTYRAGVSVASRPFDLPDGMRYQKFSGGRYARFTYTGPYTAIPAASMRAAEILDEKKIERRGDFSIENYINGPMTTPAERLITEILYPIA